MNRKPRVLVACEMSGRVRTQFAAREWDAWSADLLPDESETWTGVPQGRFNRHYQGDVLDIIEDDWDLLSRILHVHTCRKPALGTGSRSEKTDASRQP